MLLSKFSKLMDDLCYAFTIAEIKIENKKRSDLSYNTSLYRKIICKESGKHTTSSIAELLCVKTTAVTQKVNELVSKNYVTREQSGEDKRVSYLHGVEKFCPCKEAFVKRDEYVFNEIHKDYSEEEIKKFMEILERTNEYYLRYDSLKGD